MTTRDDIKAWIDRGLAEGATHMIVVCDTFDHEDYPVYAQGADDVRQKHAAHDGKNMQRVMEVYDFFRGDIAAQLAAPRAFGLPA